jgi:hypothetical protein
VVRMCSFRVFSKVGNDARTPILVDKVLCLIDLTRDKNFPKALVDARSIEMLDINVPKA